MSGQESTIDKSQLHDLVDEETTHVDVVASWENLCGVYEALKFTDAITDGERLEEFKWITQQMNSFLSKMRTKLMSCSTAEAMMSLLEKSYFPAGKVELPDRKALAFQVLKQRWITKVRHRLYMMDEELTYHEEVNDG